MAFIVLHKDIRWTFATGKVHKTKAGAEKEIDTLIKNSRGGYKRALFKISELDMRIRENKEWVARHRGFWAKK